MSDFRKTRIGVANAARLLNVRVTDLKQAVREETPIHGVMPPKPVGYLGSGAKEMHFLAGDVMDCADAMAKAKSAGRA
jgi:hypothetical protein